MTQLDSRLGGNDPEGHLAATEREFSTGIQYKNVPSGRLVKFRKEDLEKWLEKRVQEEERFDTIAN